MAFKCANCRSASVTTGVGDEVSCLNCGKQGPHAHAGEPHRWVNVDEPDEGLAVEDTAGEATVEATPEGDDE